jgi:sugar/nucleoside kinase (ribokinase family)
MKVDALCIGHACWDLCMFVDGYPAENTKGETDALSESGGGPAANAAWLLGRWAIPTALAAVVGDDDYGRRAAAELGSAGVDCRLLEARPGHVTPVSFVLINRANGSRTIMNRKVAAAPLRLSRQSLRGLNPRLLLFDGHEPEAAFTAMEAFPSAITVLDAGSFREGTAALARRVQYLVCSERFAAQATGLTRIRTCWRSCLRHLRRLNPNVIVVTLGERGLAFDDGQRQGRLDALRVKAVDTTAAGDIFHGALAFALLRSMNLGEALQLATVTAGLSVQRPGGRPSVPALSEVLKVTAHG